MPVEVSVTAGACVGPAVDGKFFRVGGQRFTVRGVTYGTFRSSQLGLFPELEQVKRDFAAMTAAGVNTVRTYTVPDRQVLDLAEEWGLRLLLGVWWDDPRYLTPPTPGAWRAMAGEARAAVRAAARDCAGHPAVLALVVGNEIPGPVVRWHGRRRVEGLLRSLCEVGKEAAPDTLFSYANYPTTEYLDTSCFDFDCFNVFLEDEAAFRRYLAQLQVVRDDRPLVLTELGLDSASHGEERQAEILDRQLRVAMEEGAAGSCVFSWTDEWWVAGTRVEGWSFGVTTEEREPKPALDVMAERYRGGLLGCRPRWPSASVVVCAYQEEATIEECLRSLVRLDYPDYEVLVVDDGSTDDTAALAARFPVQVFSAGRQGLCGARNLGLEHAGGEVVAYIDADAAADPDWLTYLVIGLDRADAAGVGGPNHSPPSDPPVAQCIDRAPGGPVHVLLDNDRAEHVPGCNMAYRRERLVEIGGFDPIYRTAGDDVDVCWKLQSRGYSIRFHAAAVVWHHPRRRVRDFWRQQVGYGRAEALVARNHPEKFNGLGQACWRGMIYGPKPVLPRRSFVYSGTFGEAPFQRLYRGGPDVRARSAIYLVVGGAGLALFDPHLWPLPLGALVGVLGLCLAHGVRVAHRDNLHPSLPLGILIGLLHLVQPVAREVGRNRSWRLAFPSPSDVDAGSPVVQAVGWRRFLAQGVTADERPRDLVALRDRLRAARLRVTVAPPWGQADLVCYSALFWQLRLTSYVQWDTLYMRLVPRLRRPRTVVALAVLFVLGAAWSLTVAAEVAAALVVLVLAEGWRFERRVRRALAPLSNRNSGSESDGTPADRRSGLRRFSPFPGGQPKGCLANELRPPATSSRVR